MKKIILLRANCRRSYYDTLFFIRLNQAVNGRFDAYFLNKKVVEIDVQLQVNSENLFKCFTSPWDGSGYCDIFFIYNEKSVKRI